MADGHGYDVVVVGGGHNGLVAAAYLARAGLRTVVCEARPVVGGAAVTEQPFGPDYQVTSLSYVVSLLPPSLVRDLSLDRHGYHVYPQGPYFAPHADGRYLALPDDRGARRDQVAKFSDKDADAIDRWDAWLDDLAGLLAPLLDEIPPKIGSRRPADVAAQLGLLRLLKGIDTRRAVEVTRLFTMSIADLLDDFFTSDAVKALLSVSGVIGTWAGPRSAGTAYVMAHHHIGGLEDGGDGAGGPTGQWGFPRGGMGGVTRAMAAAARSFGVEIRTSAPVAEITTRGGAVTGVVLDSGEVLGAPTVVTTAHPAISFLRLLDRSVLPPDFVADIERFRSRSGVVKVNLAVDRLPEFSAKPGFDPDVHGGTIVLAESLDDVEGGFQDAVAGRASRRPFADICIPSVFDDSLAPEGHHVVSMFTQWVPHEWAEAPHRAEIEAHADAVVARVEEVAPGFTSSVLHRQVIGPHEMETEYGLVGGNIFHGELSASQLFHARPAAGYADLRTPVRGLYQAGSGTHGGGGVTGIPGRNAVRQVLRDRRRQRLRSRLGEGVAVAALQEALPAPFYVDESHWARERDRVLHGEWFCAGRLATHGLDTGPGRLAVVDVAGESVLVTRTRDGELRAFYNVCRHRGSQLLPADPDAAPPQPCAAGALRCPYHSWTYDLDGRLLRAPHTDDVTDFEPEAFSLHPVGAASWAGFLWLHLTPEEAPDLSASLGAVPTRLARYPLGDLVVGRTLTYRVAANYKVVLENYNECYHCAGVHPELVRLVPSFGRGGTDLDWESGIPHREGSWTFTASGTSARAPFPGLDDDERVRHKGELLYPNLMLSLSADHVAAFTLWPAAAAQTRIDCDLLFAPEEVARDAFDPSDAAEFWDVVNRQDWAVCESVQRGMSSRAYRQGWFAPMEDSSLDIRRWLLPRLGEQ